MSDLLWHYEKDGAVVGPVTQDEICRLFRAGELPLQTRVKSRHYDAWVEASTIGGFRSLAASAAPSTAAATSGGTVSTAARPWVRFWARALDQLVAVALSVLLLTYFPRPLGDLGDVPFVMSVVMMFAWLLIEGVLLCTWGTTVGKTLMGVVVRRRDGGRLDFGTALRRSFSVWLRGMGLGVPVASLILLILGYQKLTRDGTTSWDRDAGCVVRHERIGAVRVALLILCFAGLYGIFIGGAVARAVAHSGHATGGM